MDEFDLIDLVRAHAGARTDVHLGIGDDGALLAPPDAHELVAVTDTLVAGTHFSDVTAPFDIGWKSLAVNLSDLAAMGATPAWALLALILPSGDRRFVESFAAGFADLAAQFGVALVGGDTTRGPLSATVTALGFVPTGHALRRAGAVVGDHVFVTGTLGDAAAGLRCLDKHDPLASALMSAPAGTREHLIARLDRPTPRIAAGVALRGAASACIDVSDGLLADLGHIATSSGVAIDVELDALPASSALLTLFDLEARRGFQLSGGDDYELAFTASAHQAARIAQDLSRIGCGATRIGRVVEGAGVNVVDANGKRYTSTYAGWNHFA